MMYIIIIYILFQELSDSFIHFIPKYNSNDLFSQLNSEKDKTKSLENQLNEEKKKVTQLTNDLNKEKEKNKHLINDLTEEKDKNKQLFNECNKEKQTNINLNNMINQLNIKINLLQTNLNAKIAEIENLKNEINISNKNGSDLENIQPGEKIIVAHFKSTDQQVDMAIPCKNTDIFVRIEEQLYNEYPQYKEINAFFTVGGKIIKRFKSMSDNNIKKTDKIMLNVVE